MLRSLGLGASPDAAAAAAAQGGSSGFESEAGTTKRAARAGDRRAPRRAPRSRAPILGRPNYSISQATFANDEPAGLTKSHRALRRGWAAGAESISFSTNPRRPVAGIFHGGRGDAAAATRIFRGASRGDAAAATWIVRADESRRRRGRGNSVGTRAGHGFRTPDSVLSEDREEFVHGCLLLLECARGDVAAVERAVDANPKLVNFWDYARRPGRRSRRRNRHSRGDAAATT